MRKNQLRISMVVSMISEVLDARFPHGTKHAFLLRETFREYLVYCLGDTSWPVYLLQSGIYVVSNSQCRLHHKYLHIINHSWLLKCAVVGHPTLSSML